MQAQTYKHLRGIELIAHTSMCVCACKFRANEVVLSTQNIIKKSKNQKRVNRQ